MFFTSNREKFRLYKTTILKPRNGDSSNGETEGLQVYIYLHTYRHIHMYIYIHTYIYVHIYIEFTGSYTNTFIYVMYMYLRSYNPNKMRWGRPHQFWRISGIYWRILSTGGYKVLMLPHHIHNPHSNILGLQIIWAVLSFAVLLFWQTCFVWMPLCFPAHAG